MNQLPIFLDLHDRHCVVVGGGEIAARKTSLLLKAWAKVTVVAPEICPALSERLAKGEIDWIQARFEADHLEGAWLAIATTDELAVNKAVSQAAQARNIPVNVVDQPSLCTFVIPSIIDRSPIVIAVSSSGTAPVLSRMLRARLESMIPSAYGRLATLAGAFREEVKQRLQSMQQRRIFWENIFEGPIAELVMTGQEEAAHHALQSSLNDATGTGNMGEVYLVGGGPGDPDLLTFRAMRLMQKADIVVYDALVSESVIELVRRDAERIYVGKKSNNHTLPQEEINELLVRLAQAGKRVLRLKGGDPFIFGRGGEEIDTLAAHRIPFQVVPGISAANGVSSYAGIPLTHRDYAQSVLFATGHLCNGTVDLDWIALTRPRQTVVIYMGLGGLAEICRKLIEQGLPPEMPAAVVQQGTTRHQRVVTGTVSTIPALVTAARLQSPSLTIIGEVVKLRKKLAWFEPGRSGSPQQSGLPKPSDSRDELTATR